MTTSLLIAINLLHHGATRRRRQQRLKIMAAIMAALSKDMTATMSAASSGRRQRWRQWRQWRGGSDGDYWQRYVMALVAADSGGVSQDMLALK
jgi:hypothetical protein